MEKNLEEVINEMVNNDNEVRSVEFCSTGRACSVSSQDTLFHGIVQHNNKLIKQTYKGNNEFDIGTKDKYSI